MEIEIRPPVPFTLYHLRRIYSPYDDLSCCWRGDVLYLVFESECSHYLLKIKESGTPDQSVLQVTISSNFDPFPHLSDIFSFNDDLLGFYRSTESDPVMGKLIRRYYGTRTHHTRNFFEIAVIAILEQQISMNVASTLRKRFVERFGQGPIHCDGYAFYAFPKPQDVAMVSIDDLREIGMSLNKARAIHSLADVLTDGSFQSYFLSPQFPRESIEKLIALKGIGTWSAQYILTRGLSWPDIVAYADLGLRKAISHYYRGGKMVTIDECQEFFERFSPWKHLAGFYFLMDHIENGKYYNVIEK